MFRGGTSLLPLTLPSPPNLSSGLTTVTGGMGIFLWTLFNMVYYILLIPQREISCISLWSKTWLLAAFFYQKPNLWNLQYWHRMVKLTVYFKTSTNLICLGHWFSDSVCSLFMWCVWVTDNGRRESYWHWPSSIVFVFYRGSEILTTCILDNSCQCHSVAKHPTPGTTLSCICLSPGPGFACTFRNLCACGWLYVHPLLAG